MNYVERRVLERVEENWEREIEFLRGLVRRPSTLGNEAGAQRFVAAELESMGLGVDLWPIDHAEISRMPGYSPVEWSYEGRPNLAAVWPSASGGGRSLILNGHVDVVPTAPDHHWTHEPYGAEVVDGRMYGRGAQDMKSGIAAMIFAARALMEAGVRLGGDLTLQTVIEEECTGNGALATLARGYSADAAIIPEPFAQTGMISQVGVMWARVTVRGRGSHVQSADQAVNAISKSCLLIDAIRDLEKVANSAGGRPAAFADHPHPLNYNVGKIRGGDWTSSVPEECVFEVRISTFPGADLDEASDRFKEDLLRAARSDEWLAENPPELTFYAFRAEGCTIDWDEPILAALRERHRQLSGEEMQPYASTATTDARFFNLYAGIPATCYGPSGANLHAPDEWVDLESVREVTRVLSLTIMDWCGAT